MSSTNVLKKWRKYVSLVYNVYMVQREIFLQTGNEFVTTIYMYAALFTRKRSFCKNVMLAPLCKRF